MDKWRDKKLSVNVSLSLQQYMALNELVEQGVYESVSEAVREGVERILEEHKTLPKGTKKE